MALIITQSQAARLWDNGKGCTRQRINELVRQGRFTTPVDDRGNEINGCLYLDELVNFKARHVPTGRPRLPQKELELRGLTGFDIGDEVMWTHTPKDGYGFTIPIKGSVIKVGAKTLKLSFESATGTILTAWVKRDVCTVITRASDNNPREEGKEQIIPESGTNSTTSRPVYTYTEDTICN